MRHLSVMKPIKTSSYLKNASNIMRFDGYKAVKRILTITALSIHINIPNYSSIIGALFQTSPLPITDCEPLWPIRQVFHPTVRPWLIRRAGAKQRVMQPITWDCRSIVRCTITYWIHHLWSTTKHLYDSVTLTFGFMNAFKAVLDFVEIIFPCLLLFFFFFNSYRIISCILTLIHTFIKNLCRNDIQKIKNVTWYYDIVLSVS